MNPRLVSYMVPPHNQSQWILPTAESHRLDLSVEKLHFPLQRFQFRFEFSRFSHRLHTPWERAGNVSFPNGAF